MRLCNRVLQIGKTTRTFQLCEFLDLQYPWNTNWLVFGRLRNPIPEINNRFWELWTFCVSFWTLKLEPVLYRTADSKKSQFCRALLCNTFLQSVMSEKNTVCLLLKNFVKNKCRFLILQAIIKFIKMFFQQQL